MLQGVLPLVPSIYLLGGMGLKAHPVFQVPAHEVRGEGETGQWLSGAHSRRETRSISFLLGPSLCSHSSRFPFLLRTECVSPHPNPSFLPSALTYCDQHWWARHLTLSMTTVWS